MYKIHYIIFILVILFIFHNTNNEALENFYTKDNEIEYVFWTGGFDSTFIICKFLLLDKKKVQPIYINSSIDSCKFCFSHRRNRDKEQLARNKIIKLIKKKYPEESKNLLPVKTVNLINDSKNITNEINKMKIFSRKYNQYEAMSRYTKFHKLEVNIGSVGIIGDDGKNLPDDNWGTFLRNNLKNVKDNYRITYKNGPFEYIKFPIAFLSKEKLLKIAKKHKFDDILGLSWSCWFPRNNKPCGKCNMCRERIINHKI